jgi:predicted metal-dependent phosphoesterase TrpH
MSVDLHTHSTYSDGSATPEEIVAAAARAGLAGIALTDHDNLDGIARCRAAAAAAAIEFIPGTELSVEWRDRSMHMLVYFLEPGTGPLQDRMESLRRGRAERNVKIAARLRDNGIDITIDEVAAAAGSPVVGRPHFAGVMIEKGYVATVAEAFDLYLAAGRPGYVDRPRLAAVAAIELATASGGIAVIAHPHTLGLTGSEYPTAFRELVTAGLGGIEAYYGEYSPELRTRIAAICADLGIVATGGSDYHGTYKPHLRVGIGTGDLRVPDRAMEDLVAAHALR